MKKSILLLCALWGGTCKVVAQTAQWIDVTNYYIQNPSFDNNSNRGWSITSNASSKDLNYNCQEFWNGTFNIWQSIPDIPNGTYRLSVQGYYRMTDNSTSMTAHNNGTESLAARLYANSTETPLVSVYSEKLGFNYNNGCWNYRRTDYYPNNMEAAAYCFSQGMYDNQLEFTVTNGTATVGIRNDNYTSSNWAIFDNFKLEYYGTVVHVTSVSFPQKSLSLELGDSYQIEPTILPENAIFRTLSWRSTNPAIVSVDEHGIITAHSKGTATIIAISTDNTSASATCNVTVTQNDATSTSLVINEIMAANVDMFMDPSWNYGGFVELYNPTSQAVGIGRFYISDELSNLKKCILPAEIGKIPAKGFKTLWFGHSDRHTPTQVNMKLDTDGGIIYISNSEGILIAQQSYPPSMARISYARTIDGGNTWGTTAYPSPSATNTTSKFASTRLDAPIVDKDAQLFSGNLSISVQIPAGATLRYTTDGTTPTEENGLTSTTGLFNISNTTVFRFRLFQNGKLPSPIVTRSYLYQSADYQLPIISIVTDNDNIYSDEFGIFVKGNGNGLVGNGHSSKCNWNTDWERPVNFEYITTDNQCILTQEADISSCGGWSRAFNPHSFKIKAGKKFDEHLNYFQFRPFAAKPHLRHKVLQIRNGGNDTSARFIDPSIQEIIQRSGIDIDGQAYQPTIHFINGNYIGVINMREPNNKHFSLANKGYDTDDLDQFEMSPDSGYVQMAGDKKYFSEWYDLSFNAADDAVYQQICESYVDIDEYTNYMASQIYIGGTDFPQNNVKAYRPRVENGKFRFVTFDLDFALSTSDPFGNMFNKQHHLFDTLYDTTDAIASGKTLQGNRVYDEIEIVTIFINMLQNDTFRKKFIDTFCLIAGSVFEPTRCQQIVDELKARVYDSMTSSEQSALNSSANKVRNGFSASLQDSRTNLMKNNYNSYFHLSDTERQAATLSANIPEAHLLYNGMPVPTDKFSGYVFAPVTLRAMAPGGYKFIGWKDENATVVTTSTTLFAKGSRWSYYDQGSLDGTTWKSTFNSSWPTGNAPLGYFTSDASNARGYQTILDYGNNASNKRPTYYFARQISISSAPSANDVIKLNFTADDGFIIYVNGTEAGRYLMKAGEATYSTFASSYAPGNPDTGTLTLSPSLFRVGNNLITVEVHNNNANSTDIYWDAELLLETIDTDVVNYLSTEETITLPTSGAIHLTACYEPIDASDLAITDTYPIKVNEVGASNSVYVNEYFKYSDWIELYNNTDTDLDVAGLYLSDDVDNPLKYQIPASNGVINTIIPSGGFLPIWADNLEATSEIHSNFKLSNTDGSMVIVSSSDEFVENNAAFYASHPHPKNFVEGLTYTTHQGTESVGRYPDGGRDFYLMARPTIERSNTLTTTDRIVGSDVNLSPEDNRFTIDLQEGWNWFSHNLRSDLSVGTDFARAATRIVGAKKETILDPQFGWTGSLKSLSAGHLYKVQMSQSETYTHDKTYGIINSAIHLLPGWNWIGYPVEGAQTLSAAFSNYLAEEGDEILGQDGFATYENGIWAGTLSSLETGKGYLFKTSHAKTLLFAEPSVSVKIRKAALRKANVMDGNNVNKYAYPNVMGFIAQLCQEDNILEAERFTIYAYAGDECRGVSKPVNGIHYLSIYGLGGEEITFRAIDQLDGTTYDIEETQSFALGISGTAKTPRTLSLVSSTNDDATTIDLVQDHTSGSASSKVIGYYSMSGQFISLHKTALSKGIYIVKLENGNHSKLYIP